MIKILLG